MVNAEDDGVVVAVVVEGTAAVLGQDKDIVGKETIEV